MTTRQKTVLITRPKEDSGDFARQVEQAGFKTLVEPVLRVVPIDFTLPPPGSYYGLVFTSANGVRMLPGGFRPDIPVYCVGDHSAAQASIQGFHKIISAGGTVADLSALMQTEKALAGRKLLHIRGEHSSTPLAGAGVLIAPVIAYRTVAVESFSPECMAALGENAIDAVTFFSTRTARSFMEIIEKCDMNPALKSIKLLCISDAVLESVRSYGWAGTYTARTPDMAGMLALLKTLQEA